MKNFRKMFVVLISAVSVAAALWFNEPENPPQQPPEQILAQPPKQAPAQSSEQVLTQPAAGEDADITIYPLEIVQTKESATGSSSMVAMTVEVVEEKKLPVLVNLSGDGCPPCKAMKPIFKELAAEYNDKFEIISYDVWKEPAYAEKYNIKLIPTQLFLDADGKELYRHQGFFSKKKILNKWKKFGFDFDK